jgi:ER-Golgi trafficking TRAPP I complex 85 kDa subunit
MAFRRSRLQSSTLPCVSQVMAQRKGLRNQFRSFLGIRKSGSSSGLSPEPARSGAVSGRYDASTAEFQLRQLADAAFMLQVERQDLLFGLQCPGLFDMA